MTTYPLTVRYELDDDWMHTLVEMAGYGISYWATKGVSYKDGDTWCYRIGWEDSGAHTRAVTFGKIARAVQRIIDPSDGCDLNPESRAAVAAAVLDPGDIDADVADLVIQVAVLGKVIYG